jgi:hypothetical protein
VSGQIRYDSGSSVTSSLTKFREALQALGNEPTPEDLERLITFVRSLEPGDRAPAGVAKAASTLDRFTPAHPLNDTLSPAPPQTPDPFSPGDQCYFAAPVRLGRRRSDGYGHLVLTDGQLKFRGTFDLSVAWADVAAVHHAGREIVVALETSRRLLRFSCHSPAESERGGSLAEDLARRARPHSVDVQTAYQHGAI